MLLPHRPPDSLLRARRLRTVGLSPINRSSRLTEDEYALFQLLLKKDITKTDREKLKFASHSLLEALVTLIGKRERWTEKERTAAEFETLILDHVYTVLTAPPLSEDDKQAVAKQVY